MRVVLPWSNPKYSELSMMLNTSRLIYLKVYPLVTSQMYLMIIKVRILESFVCFAWLISLLVRVLVLIKHTGSPHTIKINCEFISSESDGISKNVIAQGYYLAIRRTM